MNRWDKFYFLAIFWGLNKYFFIAGTRCFDELELHSMFPVVPCEYNRIYTYLIVQILKKAFL